MWPVHYARPQPFKKHPKHRFYPWLKWHTKHVTWVFFDINRDSSIRFNTLNKEYCVISPVILYLKQGSLFHNLNKVRSIRKDLVTSSCQSGHSGGLNEKKWFLLSYVQISLIYLPFVCIWNPFCCLFSDISCF